MTKEELFNKWSELEHQAIQELEEARKHGISYGLDGSPIGEKYRKLQEDVYEKYKSEQGGKNENG